MGEYENNVHNLEYRIVNYANRPYSKILSKKMHPHDSLHLVTNTEK